MDLGIVGLQPVWVACILTIFTFALTLHLGYVFLTTSRKHVASGCALPLLPFLAVLNVVGPLAWIVSWMFDRKGLQPVLRDGNGFVFLTLTLVNATVIVMLFRACKGQFSSEDTVEGTKPKDLECQLLTSLVITEPRPGSPPPTPPPKPCSYSSVKRLVERIRENPSVPEKSHLKVASAIFSRKRRSLHARSQSLPARPTLSTPSALPGARQSLPARPTLAPPALSAPSTLPGARKDCPWGDPSCAPPGICTHEPVPLLSGAFHGRRMHKLFDAPPAHTFESVPEGFPRPPYPYGATPASFPSRGDSSCSNPPTDLPGVHPRSPVKSPWGERGPFEDAPALVGGGHPLGVYSELYLGASSAPRGGPELAAGHMGATSALGGGPGLAASHMACQEAFARDASRGIRTAVQSPCATAQFPCAALQSPCADPEVQGLSALHHEYALDGMGRGAEGVSHGVVESGEVRLSREIDWDSQRAHSFSPVGQYDGILEELMGSTVLEVLVEPSENQALHRRALSW